MIRIRTGERGHDALTYEGDIDIRKELEADLVNAIGISD